MNTLRIVTMLGLLTLWTPWTFAHGTGQHVLGTVAAIDASHIEVTTPKGGNVTVRVTQNTRYRSQSVTGTDGLPKPGDRVVIEVTKDGDVLIATEVRFASAKSPGASGSR